MIHRAAHRAPSLVRSVLLAVAVFGSTAGCGGDDAEEEALRAPSPQPPSTVAPLATNTPDDAAEDGAGGAAAVSDDPSGGEAGSESGDGGAREERGVAVPSGDAVVVQIARIENVPWEPQILAQMVPHFSVRADGSAVFWARYGDSDIGWYQTVVAPADIQSLLEVLVNEVAVVDLAESRESDPIVFETGTGGSPAGCDAYGVIYVKTAADEARVVLSECELESPEGPFQAELARLNEVVNTLETWKYVVDHSGINPDVQAGFRRLMGWYSSVRAPWTPESAVAFGTRARRGIPSDAAISGWVLDTPLSEMFDAEYGAKPAEAILEGGDVVLALRSAFAFKVEKPPSFWGPLYLDADRQLYSVGFRPSVPGSNNVTVDYEYELPNRGIGAGR